MPSREELFDAAARLHSHLLRRHLDRDLLRGPDPGVRFNLRAWRFAKAALDFVPWRDNYVFMQTQGYWALANWMLWDATGEPRYREWSLQVAEAVRQLQRCEGFWDYPLPERRHLIATLEGVWASITLLAAYEREPRKELLAGAVRWYDFLIRSIGFQSHPPGKAVNYFDRPRGKVPNNSVVTAWFLLRLWKATGDNRYLEHVDALLRFVAQVQLPAGEIPYIVESPYEKGRQHYLCFQYNAFQFLELARCARLRPGDTPRQPQLARLANLLQQGVRSTGACAYDCLHPKPEVDYYAAVLAAALAEARRLGLAATDETSQRCYSRVLSRQEPDGGFGFSSRDYGFLRDRRSYPRQQAMTLFNLLSGCGLGDGFPKSTL